MSAASVRDLVLAFARQLQRTRGVEVVRRWAGAPLRRERLAGCRGLLPADLLEVYASANGFGLEWRFTAGEGRIEDGNGGCVLVPAAGENLRGFQEDVGMELEDDVLVRVLDKAPILHEARHVAVYVGKDDLHLFDGNYAAPLALTPAAFVRDGLRWGFAFDWLGALAHDPNAVARARLVRERLLRLGVELPG